MTEREELFARIRAVQKNLAEASEGRYPVPRLIAVTKTHPVEMILPLREAGVLDIGENRVQEMMEKLPALQSGAPSENFRLHLIGRLQTNKVKYIIKDVHLIQSVDRMELAREIDRRAQQAERRVPVLLQLSPVGEPQKGGLPMADAEAFLREAARLPGLEVRGLMAVMPLTDGGAEAQQWLTELFRGMRQTFERLRDLAIEGIHMEELSMGMSGDYLLAARCGATMVRVGSAIFGPRGSAHNG